MKTRFIVLILSLTQEKVFDLHSLGGALLVTEKEGRLWPAQNTAKVKRKLQSQ